MDRLTANQKTVTLLHVDVEDQVVPRLARDFAYQEVRPLARRRDREPDPVKAFAPELVRRASELGLRTLKIPVEDGGLGADCLTEVIVLEELSVGDVGFGMTLAHAWREGYVLARFTTEEQRRRFLPEFMADDTYLTCFAITEEHAGSDHGLPYDGDLEAGVFRWRLPVLGKVDDPAGALQKAREDVLALQAVLGLRQVPARRR